MITVQLIVLSKTSPGAEHKINLLICSSDIITPNESPRSFVSYSILTLKSACYELETAPLSSDEQGGLYIYYNFTLSLEHYSRFVVYD
jgi:hypothetical protein